MSTGLQGAISSAISEANSKAAQKSEGNFNEQLAKDKVASANNRISVAESKLNRYQGEKAKIQESYNPPPTKEQNSGGKENKVTTVVDNEELSRLKSKEKGVDQQIAQVQQEVQEAQETAQAAANEAIKQSGINQETQSEMDRLLTKAKNIKNTLSAGGNVEDDQIKSLVENFNKASEGLTQEQNKAGILSESFYKPMADYLKDISDLLKNPPGNPNDANGDGVEEAGLAKANKELNDVGITDINEQTKFIDLNKKLSEFEVELDKNQGFTADYSQEDFTKLVDQHKEFTKDLTDTQKDTGVIKDSQDIIDRVSAAGGAGGD